jgi:hypothetical protein
LVQNSPKEGTELGRKIPKFPQDPRLEAFTVLILIPLSRPVPICLTDIAFRDAAHTLFTVQERVLSTDNISQMVGAFVLHADMHQKEKTFWG